MKLIKNNRLNFYKYIRDSLGKRLNRSNFLFLLYYELYENDISIY